MKINLPEGKSIQIISSQDIPEVPDNVTRMRAKIVKWLKDHHKLDETIAYQGILCFDKEAFTRYQKQFPVTAKLSSWQAWEILKPIFNNQPSITIVE